MAEASMLNSPDKLPVDTSHKVLVEKEVPKTSLPSSLETSDSEPNNGLSKNSSEHADKSRVLELPSEKMRDQEVSLMLSSVPMLRLLRP